MVDKSSIFISSTFEDLKNHRDQLLFSLASLKQQVEAMEYWGPSSSTPLELSLEKIEESSVYVGIIGARYGTVAKDGKSITQLEYEHAVKLNLERFVYIIDGTHPIPLEFIERGLAYEKLCDFKKIVSSSVRGKFTSPSDLARQIVTHLIQRFDRIGPKINPNLTNDGIQEFLLEIGYSFSMTEETIDITPFINLDRKGKLTIADPFVELVFVSSIIATNFHHGNYKLIENIVSFKPEIYNLVPVLIRHIGIKNNKLSEAITKCTFPATLRLLIAIAGKSAASNCAEPICRILCGGQDFHNRIKSYNLLVTPFNDIAKEALSQMPKKEVEPIIRKYFEYAKKEKLWQAKKSLEWALKKLK